MLVKVFIFISVLFVHFKSRRPPKNLWVKKSIYKNRDCLLVYIKKINCIKTVLLEYNYANTEQKGNINYCL